MSANATKRDNHTSSCVICQRRKVKCDRVMPCAPCTKSRLPCSYKAPAERRRKRSKHFHDHDRVDGALRQHEELVQTVSFGEIISQTREREVEKPRPDSYLRFERRAKSISTPLGVSVADDGGDYLSAEPASLQSCAGEDTAGETIQDQTASLDVGATQKRAHAHLAQVDDDSGKRTSQLVFGHPHPNDCVENLANGQTPAETETRLWESYLTHVDPVFKILHIPTVQRCLATQSNESIIPQAKLQALKAAISFVSVVSLPDDERLSLLHLPNYEAISTYRRHCEEALSAAVFVTSIDIDVLQAFVLYLAALQSIGEYEIVWSLIGIAIRLARRTNLDCNGQDSKLSPFKNEMRRRLWWTMIDLQTRNADMMEQYGELLSLNFNVQLPANSDDDQFSPQTEKIPRNGPVPTEATYARYRAIVASSIISTRDGLEPGASYAKLESRLKEEILSFCDPSIPLQKFTINSAAITLTSLRLINHPNGPTPTSPEACSESYFQQSLGFFQLHLALYTDLNLRKWQWCTPIRFPWYRHSPTPLHLHTFDRSILTLVIKRNALSMLIRQTRLQPSTTERETAWSLICEVFNTIVPRLHVRKAKVPILRALQQIFNSTPPTETEGIDGGKPRVKMRAGRRRMAPFGAPPHSALLPGMGEAIAEKSASSGAAAMRGEVHGAQVDWDEVERLESYVEQVMEQRARA